MASTAWTWAVFVVRVDGVGVVSPFIARGGSFILACQGSSDGERKG